jgi:hypothetical protein
MKFLTFSKIYFIFSGLLFTVFSARILGVEKYGETVFAIGLCYTFDFIFSGKYEINILKSKIKATEIVNPIVKGSFILCFFIFIISLILTVIYSYNFYFYPFISLLSGLQAILQMDVNKNYDLKYLGFNNILVGTFTVSIGSLLVYFFNETGYFYSILSSLFLSVFFYSSKIDISFKKIYNVKPLYFWNNKLSNVISSFSLTSFGDVLPIFIKVYFDSYVLGIYQLNVKFIKTGLFFVANLFGNYLIKMDYKVKVFTRYTFFSLLLYLIVMLGYSYFYKMEFFNNVVSIFIDEDSSSFIEYSIYFLSIFLLDSIVISTSSLLIRHNVNFLTLIRVFQLSTFLFILFFNKLTLELVSLIISVSMILSLLFSSYYIKKNQK